jgi:signal transduction histidine kinase
MRMPLRAGTFLPGQLFTPQVFFVSLAWMAVLHFLDWENNNGLSQPGQRAVALVVAHLATFALPAVVFLGLRTRISEHQLTLLLIVAILIAAPLRGFAFFHLLEWINGADTSSVGLRMAGSLTNVTFAVVLAWFGFSAAEHHNRRKQRLIKDRQQLLLMRNQARSQLASMDRDSAEQIRSTLLDGINMQPTNAADAGATLRKLIDDVVRPLSRYFEQQSDRWVPPDPPESLLRIKWRSVLANVLDPRNIQPGLVVALMYWVSMVNTAVNRGIVIAVVSAVHFAAMLPLFALSKRVAVAMARGRHAASKAALFLAALVIPAQTLGLTSWFYTRFQEPQFFYATVAPIFVLIGGTLIAFAQSLLGASAALEDELRSADANLRWSLARAREQHRQQRRSLAHALHGQVQAALASAVLRLEMVHRDGDDKQAVQRIVADLRASISNVNMLHATSEPVETVIEHIQATWTGVARITVALDAGLSQRLASDQVCTVALNDVLTELTYNSIKHGGATAIHIDLAPSDDRLLQVVVTDNGRRPSQESRRGMGSELLDDCAVTWQRSRDREGTRTELLLPCQAARGSEGQPMEAGSKSTDARASEPQRSRSEESGIA